MYYVAMEKHTDHLAAAACLIIRGEQRVAEQMMRVEKLAAAGFDTTDAESFLETLMLTLALMYKHLQIERTYTPH